MRMKISKLNKVRGTKGPRKSEKSEENKLNRYYRSLKKRRPFGQWAEPLSGWAENSGARDAD